MYDKKPERYLNESHLHAVIRPKSFNPTIFIIIVIKKIGINKTRKCYWVYKPHPSPFRPLLQKTSFNPIPNPPGNVCSPLVHIYSQVYPSCQLNIVPQCPSCWEFQLGMSPFMTRQDLVFLFAGNYNSLHIILLAFQFCPKDGLYNMATINLNKHYLLLACYFPTLQRPVT